MERHNIIDKNLSERLKKLTSFRNFLVHLYYDIDLNIVYNLLKNERIALGGFFNHCKRYNK
ncbi:hypothetical protein MJ1_0382 [Nanobdella aerobiophila]|uniref:DUF86 domain-containing protein n=1 Tax=Nanobdella aerobiophila TaxID=2586965 RepID=A0A915SSQ3_9ARCH|nr:hypothetical protein MJ1_0382 [Nanobdella aerobiophila]